MIEDVTDANILVQSEQNKTQARRPIALLLRVLEAASATLLFGIVSLILVSVFYRYFLNNAVVWSDEIAKLMFVWMCMLGAPVALHRGEHVRLSVFVARFPDGLRGYIQTFSSLVVVLLSIILVKPAYDHAVAESIVLTYELKIPLLYYLVALAVGFVLMAVVGIEQIWRSQSQRQILIASASIATVLLISWILHDNLAALGQYNILIFLVGFTFIALVCGVPVSFCFGIGAVSFLAFATKYPLTVMVGRIDEGISSPILLSVPVFILLGNLLDVTGMGKAIVGFLVSLVGHIKAGMSYVLLGSLYLVSGISGSKVSDMATVAPALFPEMRRRGNRPSEMVALLATGSIMADTVPPSIVLIVLASVSGVSVGSLFTSGFVIAFVLLVVLAVVARWQSAGEDMSHVKRPPPQVVAKVFAIAAPALILPFLIRFAVSEGVATPTEVSTVAVLYAFLVGYFLYGGFSLASAYKIFVDAASLSGAMLLILGMATCASWALITTGIAYTLRDFMVNLPGGPLTFMFVSILIFLVLGSLLEGMPALVLLAPILFPIATSLGINGVQYGMVAVVAINIGLFLPPVGVGLYIACSISQVNPEEVMPSLWKYIIALFVGLIIIALVPAVSTAII